jgi:predicted Zn finger-like uncharacterized protein
MAIKLTCPDCEAALTVPESFLGKTLRCKHCGETFKAKAPKRAVEDDDEPRPARKRPRDDDERPRKVGTKKRKQKQKSQMPLILGLVGGVFVLLGVGLGVYWLSGRSQTPERDDMADSRAPNLGRYRQDELFGPADNGSRSNSTGPVALTAEQRKILGKWTSPGSHSIKTLEFKPDGEVIVGMDAGGGRINEDRGRFRFLEDKTFVLILGGIELDVFTYTIIEMDGSRMVAVDRKYEYKHEFEKID